MHPSSVNFPVKDFGGVRHLMYHLRVLTSKQYLRDCSPIHPYALLLFGGTLHVDHVYKVVSVDSWIQFALNPKAAVLTKELRLEMTKLLLAKIEQPNLDITEAGTVL